MKVNTCQMWPLINLGKVAIQNGSLQTTENRSDEAGQQQPIPRLQSNLPASEFEDRIMNYGLQILQMGVLLMQMNDTEKEGDGEQALGNRKLLLLYFRSRPRAKKYAYEAMRVISYSKALFTEKMARRVLQGQFINIKGGKGNNVANDLKMEHLIKYNKVILHDLCGNKTLKAIQRS